MASVKLKFFKLSKFDWSLLAPVFLLVIFGLIIQYGLALGTAQIDLSFFNKQLIFALIGFILVFLLGQVDFRIFKSLGYIIYFLTFVALIMVLVWGKTFHGVRGWLSFGLFNFQLVELAKLSTIIVLAIFWQKTIRSLPFNKIIISLLFVLPLIALVVMQPDLGSALILFIIWLGMIIIVNRDPKHLIKIFISIILIAVLVYFFALKDYQRERLLTFFNLNYDPFGRGYQIRQATVAIGSGKFFGRGLFSGPQSQLRFLPASQTDFIFVVLAEKTGLFGCLIILILFFIFFRQLIRIAQKTYDNFGSLLTIGILINFLIHFILNVGMNLGLLPIVGIPLPFLSYGGSSLIISLILVGLIESIVVNRVSGSKEEI
ncbi:MAG: FtsW/RodA/SpoVE family cell cycle protein [Patescibacteria group bacterium]